MVIDVIASHSPAVDVAFCDLLHGFTKAAPVQPIAVASKSALVELLFQIDIGLEVVFPDEVILEAFSTSADLRTSFELARPGFETEVLTALVPLPVILTAELSYTTFPSATIWLLVAFLVLPTIIK